MITKRQLGIFILASGLLAVTGVLTVDIFGAGEWSGFGPLQRIGVGLGLLAILVGCILICLGDRPA